MLLRILQMAKRYGPFRDAAKNLVQKDQNPLKGGGGPEGRRGTSSVVKKKEAACRGNAKK